MLAASAISSWGYLISIVDEDGFKPKSVPLRDVAYKTRGFWKVLERVWQIASPMPRFYAYIKTTATWLRAHFHTAPVTIATSGLPMSNASH